MEIAVIPPRVTHTGTVIFLHGLGQATYTWKCMIMEALAPRLPHVQWLLPQAPKRPVSYNQGERRPSWFDIRRLPPGPEEFDEAAISQSVSAIENIILGQVHAGIDSRRIILVGFSQGAALSMMVSLTTLHELGGVVSLSGWIPARARGQMIHAAPRLPVLWCHGTHDDEIPIALAQDAVSFLHQPLQINQLTYKTYAGLAHTINDQELDDFAEWLHRVLR